MPRPKGSKNKVKMKETASANFEALIAEKTEAKESLSAEVVSLEENLNALKSELKAKKADLKRAENELAKLEDQKQAYETAQAEAAKKAELEGFLQKLMADGMSASEILEKLK